jgi:hypothetical protein
MALKFTGTGLLLDYVAEHVILIESSALAANEVGRRGRFNTVLIGLFGGNS